ncbi:lipoprotein intramolecular transacylase Lit [Thiohalomonas denitrificans]|uniref:Integral membrane protein TIGR01906 n=1 Tax=Thiohalomonas denitrificans TaxID=415747 RepID=A0A1G5QWZ5_9GAMM|nr:DUF1461 domain-containing protein [Thiohalomonas denitrificans]SCZ66267.1 Protein of unknown function [Thiohalomonas denitrificans]
MTFATDLARRFSVAVLQTLFIVSLAVTAAGLAWSSLRVVDFGYPWLYETLTIEQHIEQWAARNRYRPGFEATIREEHLAIFSAISTAVHQQGEGLDTIRYRDHQDNTHPFLRTPERVHLQSVARLIDRFYRAVYLAVALLVVGAVLLRQSGTSVPRLSRVLIGTLVFTAVATLLVIGIGPTKLFYAAHQWIFPAGEQWYFTYQESLMTTLMKAPDLFGGIALLLAAAMLFYFGVLFTVARVLNR